MNGRLVHPLTCSSIVLLLIAITGLVSYGQGEPTSYTALNVPAAADAAHGPRAINNSGDIIGIARHFLSAQTMGPSQISRGSGLGGGNYGSASAINDAQEVVGAANTGEAVVPFISTPDGRVDQIPLMPGHKCGQALTINTHGNVAGYSSGPAGVKAFLWMRGGGVYDLGTLPGGSSSKARDLNDSNQAVGTVRTPNGDRAVLWTKAGKARDLGTWPGDSSSEATAINNSGQVVGYSNGPSGTRAFLWTKTTGMRSLGALPGGDFSRALGINDAGEVVGTSASSAGDRAFIWQRGRGLRDLNDVAANDLGVVFMEAHAINNKGEILVMGMPRDEADGSGGTHKHHNGPCAPAPEGTYFLSPSGAVR